MAAAMKLPYASSLAVGFLDADAAFLPHISLPDGRRAIEAITGGDKPMLPPPGATR